MTSLGIFLCGFLIWAWIFPRDLGRWAAKLVKAYRETVKEQGE